MTTYFVSGHLDLTIEEFREHYIPQIARAIAEDAAFVIGDARGCDLMAQLYLWDARTVRVQVFHMLKAPRHNVGGFPTIGGFPSDASRDDTMTAASSADIAWVRPGREKSGTAANLKRRLKTAPGLAGGHGTG